MSEINSKPDRNGVPMCLAQIGKECPRGRADPDKCNMGDDDGMCYDGCYPKMVEIVKAATQIALENVPFDRKGKYRAVSIEAIEALVEALSHE